MGTLKITAATDNTESTHATINVKLSGDIDAGMLAGNVITSDDETISTSITEDEQGHVFVTCTFDDIIAGGNTYVTIKELPISTTRFEVTDSTTMAGTYEKSWTYTGDCEEIFNDEDIQIGVSGTVTTSAPNPTVTDTHVYDSE